MNLYRQEVDNHNEYCFEKELTSIITSTSFRRLQDKTQLYFTSKGDHYRTRLTHTIEVSNIAREISNKLSLNTALVETISFAHDIGHTPFGHIGERVISDILSGKDNLGGILDNVYPVYFKHNVNSLRLVGKVEPSKRDFHPSWQLLDGVLKHTSVFSKKIEKSTYDPFNAFVFLKGSLLDDKDFKEFLKKQGIDNYLRHDYPLTLEGQVVATADEISQRISDFDDCVRADYVSKNLGYLRQDIQLILDSLSSNDINEYFILNDQLKDIKSLVSDSSIDAPKETNSLFEIHNFVNQIENILKITISDDCSAKVLCEKLMNKIDSHTNIINNPSKDNTFNETFIEEVKKYLINNIILNSFSNILYVVAEKLKGNGMKFFKVYKENLIFTGKIIEFSSFGTKISKLFEDFNKKHVISSYEIRVCDSASKHMIRQLFKAYYNQPKQLPDKTLSNMFNDLFNYLDLVYDKINKSDIKEKIKEFRKTYRDSNERCHDIKDRDEMLIYFRDISKISKEKIDLGEKDFHYYNNMSKIILNEIGYYIAGMTDSYAKSQYKNLYSVNAFM